MATVTAVLETYSPIHGVQHSEITGEESHILALALILQSDDTFCIRRPARDGGGCQCKKWGVL